MQTDVEIFLENLKRLKVEAAVKTISDYCAEHKNCKECGLFNGVCRLNFIPSDWDAYEIIHDGHE